MMKRQTFKFVSAALLGVAVFASCQDYTPSDELTIRQKTTSVNYEQAFHHAFPVIDPEQNWGFDPMPISGTEIEAVTRGMNTNSNEWVSEYHYEVPGGLSSDDSAPWGWSPGDITNYERAYVYWWFSTHRWPQPLEVRWSEFFVENVWGQPEHSEQVGDKQSTPYYGQIHSGMDNLHILDYGYIPANSPYDHNITNVDEALEHGVGTLPEGYEHINDFNSSGGAKEQVMYAFGVSSEDWYYRESRGGFLPDHNNWTVQYINGNYYLGFDYWCEKKTDAGYSQDEYSLIKPDGFYNDWIIKLQSGVHLVNSYTRRVMCEDLGDTFDWDFNDLVFDVALFHGDYGNGQNGYYAQITLQAAGGTLPIYIGEKNQAHEAHFLFGVDSTVPVNCDAVGGVKRPAVVFHLPIDQSLVDVTDNVLVFNPINIPIYVTRADMTDPAQAIELTANKGMAPQKFACPIDTYWMKEFQNIEGIEGKQAAGHPNFVKWVAGTITKEAKVDANDTDEVAFVTERSPQADKNFTVLYADHGDSPYSVSWWESGEDHAVIQPWKDLWNNRVNDPLHVEYTTVRSYPKVVKTDGTDNTDNNGYTTYSTTFEAQAPYIYETIGADDDPIAYSGKLMKPIFDGNHVSQEEVWGPYAKTVTLETNDGSKGYVLGSGYYTGGSNVTITAVPRRYMEFIKWIDLDNGEAIVSTDAAYTIVNLQDAKHYRAVFDNKQGKHVYFKSDPVGAGFIKNFPESGQADEWYDLGTYMGVYDFEAERREGYVFDYWNDDEDEYFPMFEVDVENEDVYLTAHFREAQQFTLTLAVDDPSHGTVKARVTNGPEYQGTGTHTFWEGTELRIEATPAPGWKFTGWYNEVWGMRESGAASYTIEMDDNKSYTAHFAEIPAPVVSYVQGSATPPSADANSTFPGGSVAEFSKFLATITAESFFQGYSLYQNVTGLSGYTECCLEIEYLAGGQVQIVNHTYDYMSIQEYDTHVSTVTQYAKIPFNGALSLGSGAERVRKITIWVKP